MSSGIWLICPGCGLQHTPRPDGRCPRCKGPSAPLETDAAGAVWRPSHARPVGEAHTTVTTGARIAGGAMILNGLVGILGSIAVARHVGSSNTVGAAVGLVGAALGVGVVAGSELARKTAIVLVVIALPVVLGFGAVTGAWAPALFAAALCLANLLLLVGDAGPLRLVPAALVLAAGCAAGIAAALAPADFAAKALAWSGMVDADAVTEARGPAWRMTFPAGHWFRMKKSLGSGGAGAMEGSFLRPDGPAFTGILPVNMPRLSSVDPDLLAKAGSEALSRSVDRWNLLTVEPLPGRGATRVLHGIATYKAREYEVLCGLFPNGPLFHIVAVGAAPPEFTRLRDELTEVLASFHSDALPMAPTPAPLGLPAAPSAR